MHIKSAMRAWAACAMLAGLAACGDSGSDSKLVEQCVAGGGSRSACRCIDRVYRAEFTAEEYKKMEGMMALGKKLAKIAPGDLEGFMKTMSEGAGKGPKDLEGAMAFYTKVAGTMDKLVKTCGRA
jgi:hypothetical protein